jgi:hypothetical protein
MGERPIVGEAVLGARLDFQCIGMDTMSRRLDGAVRYAPSFITTQSISGRPEMLYSAATLAEFLRWSPAKVEGVLNALSIQPREPGAPQV